MANKPVRVLLERDGKPYNGPITFAGPGHLPKPGDVWDDKHVVKSGRRGTDDAQFDEVILTIEQNP
jgi:hypothetical protein